MFLICGAVCWQIESMSSKFFWREFFFQYFFFLNWKLTMIYKIRSNFSEGVKVISPSLCLFKYVREVQETWMLIFWCWESWEYCKHKKFQFRSQVTLISKLFIFQILFLESCSHIIPLIPKKKKKTCWIPVYFLMLSLKSK